MESLTDILKQFTQEIIGICKKYNDFGIIKGEYDFCFYLDPLFHGYTDEIEQLNGYKKIENYIENEFGIDKTKFTNKNLFMTVLPILNLIMNKYCILDIKPVLNTRNSFILNDGNFNLNEQKIISSFLGNSQIKDNFYVFLEGICFYDDIEEITLWDTPKILFKKIGPDFFEKLLSKEVLFRGESFMDYTSVIYCKNGEFLKKNINKILSLLRIFKYGNFRAYGFFNIIENEVFEKRLIKDDFFIKEPEIKNMQTQHQSYSIINYDIRKGEDILIEKFIKNYLEKIEDESILTQYITKLHSFDYKFRIPFLFSIFESLLRDDSVDLCKVVQYSLSESDDFYEKFKNIKQLRNKIIHGNKTEIEKKKKETGKEFYEIYKELYEIFQKFAIIYFNDIGIIRNNEKIVKQQYKSKKKS